MDRERVGAALRSMLGQRHAPALPAPPLTVPAVRWLVPPRTPPFLAVPPRTDFWGTPPFLARALATGVFLTVVAVPTLVAPALLVPAFLARAVVVGPVLTAATLPTLLAPFLGDRR